MSPMSTVSFEVSFIQAAPQPLLIALIHKAIAFSLPLLTDLSALCHQGWQQYDDNQIEAALATFQALLMTAQQRNHIGYIDTALNAVAFICSAQQFRPTAAEPELPSIERAPLQAVEIPDSDSDLDVLMGLANHYQLQDNCDKALSYFQQALSWAVQQQRLTEIGLCLMGIGLAHCKQENYESSCAPLQSAIHIFEESGDRVYQAVALHNLGRVNYYLGRYTQALKNFEHALTLREEQQDRFGEMMTLSCMGQVYAYRQEFLIALACYESALEVCREFGQQTDTAREEAILLSQIAQLGERTNRPETAIIYYLNALDKVQGADTTSESAMLLHRLGRLHESLGNYAIALNYYQKALGKCQTSADLDAILDRVDLV
ncbi:MAG: tetratricopeptide repeat protein [Cyanobacteria bacterium P01_D01_bin.128]